MVNKVTNSTPAKKTVASTGTPEALSTSHTFAEHLIIQALKANTDWLAIGDSNVDVAADRGISLSAANSMDLYNVYLDEVYIDVAVNGEGVCYFLQSTRSIIPA